MKEKLENRKDLSMFPSWLRTYVYSLEHQIKSRDEKIIQLKGEIEKSNVYFVDPHDLKNEKIYLKKGTSVCFEFENGRKIRAMILKRDFVEVLDINGDDPLLITPRACNSVYIRMEKII